jgi:hypothetical protein
MKPLTATFLFILFAFFLSDRLFQSKMLCKTDIAKVISDYPNGYKNIIGEQIMENPQSIEFRMSSCGKRCYQMQADKI